MRRFYTIFISGVIVLAFFTSCSRQISGISSVSGMQTVSAQQKQVIVPVPARCVDPIQITKEDKIQTPDGSTLLIKPQKTKPDIQKGKAIKNFVKQEQKIVVKATDQYINSLVKSWKPVAEHDYPQINKAGFILIGGGILGLILRLIPIACWILIVLGLIILLSPLFHKRY